MIPETSTDLHHEAMKAAEMADLLLRQNRHEQARGYFLRAFTLEFRAALRVPVTDETRQSRGILYRSAACLAFDAGMNEVAVHTARLGRNGHPPQEIDDELQDVIAQARARIDGADYS